MLLSNYNKQSNYKHDIARWALVKYCKYPLTTLHHDIKMIPTHVIESLKK